MKRRKKVYRIEDKEIPVPIRDMNPDLVDLIKGPNFMQIVREANIDNIKLGGGNPLNRGFKSLKDARTAKYAADFTTALATYAAYFAKTKQVKLAASAVAGSSLSLRVYSSNQIREFHKRMEGKINIKGVLRKGELSAVYPEELSKPMQTKDHFYSFTYHNGTIYLKKISKLDLLRVELQKRKFGISWFVQPLNKSAEIPNDIRIPVEEAMKVLFSKPSINKVYEYFMGVAERRRAKKKQKVKKATIKKKSRFSFRRKPRL